MDLRSIKPRLLAASMVRVHPKTGEAIIPLGVDKCNRPIWPVMGGAPDDDEGKDDNDKSEEDEDEDESDDDTDDDSDEDESDDDEEDDDDKSKKSKKKGNPQAKIKALEEEKDRHYKKSKKLQGQLDEALTRLKKLEEKDLKPEEIEERRRKDQESKDKERDAATQRLRLENAFLKANDIDWVKPGQALAILLGDDDYEVEFDDSGNVDRRSLRAELRRLAKANPHLVKPKQSKGDAGGDATDNGSQRQTASSMNGNRKGKKGDKPTVEQLAKKFPALGRLTS